MLELLRSPETLLGHVIDLGGGILRLRHPDGRLLTLKGVAPRVFHLLDRATHGRSLGPTLPEDADLATALRRAGCLVPKVTPAPRVSLIGSGPLAILLAVDLATRSMTRVSCLDHVSPGDADGFDPGARRSVRAYFDGRTVPEQLSLSQRPWGDLRRCDTDLAIVACSGMEADRLVAAHLTAAGIVHVFASADAFSATIGPLVVPGRTACLNCTDIERTRDDPRWPATLSKLSTRSGGTHAGLARWASATLLTEVDWWLEHSASRLTSTSITVCRQRVGPGSRDWEPDPTCACRGRADAGLDVAA